MTCSMSQNGALPAGLRVLTEAEITPTMQQWAVQVNGLNEPIPEIGKHRKWYLARDGRTWLPLVAASLCHNYTVINGQQVPGLFHGVTLLVATTEAWLPQSAPTPPVPPPAPTKQTDWGLVALGAGAIAVVVGGFFAALKLAERPRSS